METPVKPPLLPLPYFGCLDWYAWLTCYPEATIEACENFQKQTLRNRCQILSANGPLDLIIPVKNKNSKAGIQHMEVDYKANWAWQHMHALMSAYRKSAFFEFYQTEIEQFYQQAETQAWNLWQLNIQAHLLISKWLKINSALSFTGTYVQTSTDYTDLRRDFKPSKMQVKFPYPPYLQVFADRFPFTPNLSILDLVFNLGPESGSYLSQVAKHIRHE